jgi:hypothetical protein
MPDIPGLQSTSSTVSMSLRVNLIRDAEAFRSEFRQLTPHHPISVLLGSANSGGWEDYARRIKALDDRRFAVCGHARCQIVARLDTAYLAVVKANVAQAMERILGENLVLLLGNGNDEHPCRTPWSEWQGL